MSEMNRIHYIPETSFAIKPKRPMAQVKPMGVEIPSKESPIEFIGTITGPPNAIARFLRGWADQVELVDAAETTIEIKGHPKMMPRVG